jgi:hypothetical protein
VNVLPLNGGSPPSCGLQQSLVTHSSSAEEELLLVLSSSDAHLLKTASTWLDACLCCFTFSHVKGILAFPQEVVLTENERKFSPEISAWNPQFQVHT